MPRVGAPPVGVVGLGLIGGSLALRLAAHGVEVSSYDVDPATRDAAAAAGLGVAATLEDLLAELADDAVVVLAVPLQTVARTLSTVAARPSVTITDTTSVKAPVLRAARAAGLADRYVGAHPMAGTADSGFTAATGDLLAGARWAVTLEPDTDLDRWLTVAGLITGIGGRVVPLTAVQHDVVVAWVSHLPHVLAEAMAAGGTHPTFRVLAAGSFRDVTRVAGTRPALVEAMLDGNAAAVADAADLLVETLGQVAADLRAGGTASGLASAGHTAVTNTPSSLEVELDPAAPTLAADLLALGFAGGWLTDTGPPLRATRPR